MNLFRSGEHVRTWAGFDPSTEDGIIALPDLARLFSVGHFTRRLDPDFVSRGLYAEEFIAALDELGSRPFWTPA